MARSAQPRVTHAETADWPRPPRSAVPLVCGSTRLGELWIADGRRGLRHVLPNGAITSLDLGAGPYDIQSVVGDSAGHLYATTVGPDYLLQVDPASGQASQVVGTGTSGYNGTTDPNLGNLLPGNQVQIDHPTGLAVRLDGDVLFADSGNNLVRAYVPAQGHVIDLAGLVENGTTPQGGFNGDGQYADNTELNQPQAVTTTSDGRYLFWVADTANSRVRLLGPNAADTSAAPAGLAPRQPARGHAHAERVADATGAPTRRLADRDPHRRRRRPGWPARARPPGEHRTAPPCRAPRRPPRRRGRRADLTATRPATTRGPASILLARAPARAGPARPAGRGRATVRIPARETPFLSWRQQSD